MQVFFTSSFFWVMQLEFSKKKKNPNTEFVGTNPKKKKNLSLLQHTMEQFVLTVCAKPNNSQKKGGESRGSTNLQHESLLFVREYSLSLSSLSLAWQSQCANFCENGSSHEPRKRQFRRRRQQQSIRAYCVLDYIHCILCSLYTYIRETLLLTMAILYL